MELNSPSANMKSVVDAAEDLASPPRDPVMEHPLDKFELMNFEIKLFNRYLFISSLQHDTTDTTLDRSRISSIASEINAVKNSSDEAKPKWLLNVYL